MSDRRELVELRIHGVSGTPPEAMLEAQFVTRCAGDATTGFYVPDPDAAVPGAAAGRSRPRARGVLLAWDDVGISGAGAVGVAGALRVGQHRRRDAPARRRPRPARPRLGGLHAALMRLFGLSLTLTLVMATFIASIDELAWQCGNNPACVGGHTPTKYLGWSRLRRARRVASR